MPIWRYKYWVGKTRCVTFQQDWRAELTLDDMCTSAWRWQSRNKYGFSVPPEEGRNGTA